MLTACSAHPNQSPHEALFVTTVSVHKLAEGPTGGADRYYNFSFSAKARVHVGPYHRYLYRIADQKAKLSILHILKPS